MSGIEILGIAASVIQIADAGARLSTKLFVFTRKVKSADRAIQDISHEIAATGAALRELGEALEQDKYASLGSRHSVDQTSQIVADCWKVFTDINETIGGDKLVKGQEVTDEKVTSAIGKFKQPSFTFKQRFRFPFIEPQINQLRSKLESLKSSLVLMLQVLLLAEQVRNRPKAQISEDQKALIKTLVQEKNAKDLEFRKSCLAIEDVPTAEPSLEKGDTDNQTLVEQTSTSEDRSLDSTEPYVNTAIPRAVPVFQANVALTAETPLPESSISPRFSLKWASSKSSLMASSETLGNSSADPSMPPSLRIREEEIQHHALLVHNLLQEISDVQYRIDHGIRHRMHDGVLKIHWDEWAPFATKYGHGHFHRAFEQHKHVARYWLDLQEGTKPALLLLAPPAKKMIHVTDAIGRNFSFPFEKCRQWTDMVDLMCHIFEHDDRFRRKVVTGQFDLFTEDKNIILPRFWDAIVEPDMKIHMELRPVQYARTTSMVSPPPIRPYVRGKPTFSSSRWISRENSSDYGKFHEASIASLSSRSRRRGRGKNVEVSSSDDSADGLFGLPLSSKVGHAQKPTLKTDNAWSQTRVADFLVKNKFSQEWVAAFQILGLKGDKFLAFGSSSSLGTLRRAVYQELERLFLRGGKSWERALAREEGKRLRKLIIGITRASVPSHIDPPAKTDAAPESQVSDETLDQRDDASQRFKPQAHDVFDQGQLNLLRDQIIAFKSLSKNKTLPAKLQENLNLSKKRDSTPEYGWGVDTQLVTSDEGLPASDPYLSWDSAPWRQAQNPGHEADVQLYGHRPMPIEVEDESREKGPCPHPDCGRIFRDLKAHMLTHQAERPEKCPIASCEYHQRGFSRKYDNNRHLLTHFKGRIICPFCPGFGTSSETVLNRLDAFRRHLLIMHGVEQVFGRRRLTDQKDRSEMKDVACPSSTCKKTFHSAQKVYEHLDECICASLLREEVAQPPVSKIDQMKRAPVLFGQQLPPTNLEEPMEFRHLKNSPSVVPFFERRTPFAGAAHPPDHSSEEDVTASKTQQEIDRDADKAKKMNDLATAMGSGFEQQNSDIRRMELKSENVGDRVTTEQESLNTTGDVSDSRWMEVIQEPMISATYIPGGDSFGPSAGVEDHQKGPDVCFVEENGEFGLKTTADFDEGHVDANVLQGPTEGKLTKSRPSGAASSVVEAVKSNVELDVVPPTAQNAFNFGTYVSDEEFVFEQGLWKRATVDGTKRPRPEEGRNEQVIRIVAKRKKLAELQRLRKTRRSQARASSSGRVMEDKENILEWSTKEFDPTVFGEALEIQDSIMAQSARNALGDAVPGEELDSLALPAGLMLTGKEADEKDKAAGVDGDKTFTCNKIWDNLQSSEKFGNGKIDIDNLVSDLRAKARTPGDTVVVDSPEIEKLLEANAKLPFAQKEQVPLGADSADEPKLPDSKALNIPSTAEPTQRPALSGLLHSRREIANTRTIIKRSQSETCLVCTSGAPGSSNIDLYHQNAIYAGTTGTVPASMANARRSRSQDATTKAKEQVTSLMTLGRDFSSRDTSSSRERRAVHDSHLESSMRLYERGTGVNASPSSDSDSAVVKVIRDNAGGNPILTTRDREVTYTGRSDGKLRKSVLTPMPSRPEVSARYQEYYARVDSDSDSNVTQKATVRTRDKREGETDTREAIITSEPMDVGETRPFSTPREIMERRRQRERQRVVDLERKSELNPPSPSAYRPRAPHAPPSIPRPPPHPSSRQHGSPSKSPEDAYYSPYSAYRWQNLQLSSQRQQEKYWQGDYHQPTSAFPSSYAPPSYSQHTPLGTYDQTAAQPQSQIYHSHERPVSTSRTQSSSYPYQDPYTYDSYKALARRPRASDRQDIPTARPIPRRFADKPTSSRGFAIRSAIPVASSVAPTASDGGTALPGAGEVKIYRRIGPDGVMTVIDDAEDSPPAPLSTVEREKHGKQEVEAPPRPSFRDEEAVSQVNDYGFHLERERKRPLLATDRRRERGRFDRSYEVFHDREDEEDLFMHPAKMSVDVRERKTQGRRPPSTKSFAGFVSDEDKSDDGYHIVDYEDESEDEADPFAALPGKHRYLSGFSGHHDDEKDDALALTDHAPMWRRRTSGSGVRDEGYGAGGGGLMGAFMGGTMSYGGDAGAGEDAGATTGLHAGGAETRTATAGVGSRSGSGSGSGVGVGAGEGLYDLLSQYTNLREEEIAGVAEGY